MKQRIMDKLTFEIALAMTFSLVTLALLKCSNHVSNHVTEMLHHCHTRERRAPLNGIDTRVNERDRKQPFPAGNASY